MEGALTIGELQTKLRFLVENGYVTKDHHVLVGGGDNPTYAVGEVCAPAVILDEHFELKKVAMLFTPELSIVNMGGWAAPKSTAGIGGVKIGRGQKLCQVNPKL